MALSDADVQKQVRTCGWDWRTCSAGPGVANWNPAAQGGRRPRAAQIPEEGPLRLGGLVGSLQERDLTHSSSVFTEVLCAATMNVLAFWFAPRRSLFSQGTSYGC